MGGVAVMVAVNCGVQVGVWVAVGFEKLGAVGDPFL